MSLTIVLVVAVLLSVVFHFLGVYAGAKKIVWLMLVLMWAAGIDIAMSEIKPSGYKKIKEIQGKFADTDALIKNAGDEISVYEMLGIMQSYQINSPKK